MSVLVRSLNKPQCFIIRYVKLKWPLLELLSFSSKDQSKDFKSAVDGVNKVWQYISQGCHHDNHVNIPCNNFYTQHNMYNTSNVHDISFNLHQGYDIKNIITQADSTVHKQMLSFHQVQCTYQWCLSIISYSLKVMFIQSFLMLRK